MINFILVHFQIKHIIICFHCVDACSCLAMAVTIFFNVSNNNGKIEHVLVSLTYKMWSEYMQLSILFWFYAKEEFYWIPMAHMHVLA